MNISSPGAPLRSISWQEVDCTLDEDWDSLSVADLLILRPCLSKFYMTLLFLPQLVSILHFLVNVKDKEHLLANNSMFSVFRIIQIQ